MDAKELQKALSGGEVDLKAMPNVKIATPDGKPTSIDDYDSFMQFLMTASMNAQLLKIRKYFDDRTSNGLIQTWGMDPDNPLTITDELVEIKLDFPAQSLSLFNDDNDSDSVYVWVNDLGRPKATVKGGEALNLNYETHKINYLYLQCAAGETADVRIVAKD